MFEFKVMYDGEDVMWSVSEYFTEYCLLWGRGKGNLEGGSC
jgi:hypothetical protein